jgi:hypothetical protein
VHVYRELGRESFDSTLIENEGLVFPSVPVRGSFRACSVIFNPYGLKGIDTD